MLEPTENCDVESIDDLLNDVDQFIDGINREFNIAPVRKEPSKVRRCSNTNQRQTIEGTVATPPIVALNTTSSTLTSSTVASLSTLTSSTSISSSRLTTSSTMSSPTSTTLSSTSSSTSTSSIVKEVNPRTTTDTIDLDSVDDLLNNVDQFINGVYGDISAPASSLNTRISRTLNPIPLPPKSPVIPVTTAAAMPSTSNDGSRGDRFQDNSHLFMRYNDGRRQRSQYISASSLRSIISQELGRFCDTPPFIHHIRDKVNQATPARYRSHSGNSRSSSTATQSRQRSATGQQSSRPPAQQSSRRHVCGVDCGGRRQLTPSPPPPQVAPEVIDLSQIPTQRPDDNDEDVLLVSANINPVISQSTSRHQQPQPTGNGLSVQFNTRRGSEPTEDVISVVLGPTTAQRRRVEIRFNYQQFQTQAPANTAAQTNNIVIPNNTSTCGNSTNINSAARPANSAAPANPTTPAAPTTTPLSSSIPSNTTAQSNTTTQSINNAASSSSDLQDPPFMCAVCMDSSLQRQPTSTRCGHIFCNECIRHAIRLTRKCPLCNTQITNNQIFRLYL